MRRLRTTCLFGATLLAAATALAEEPTRPTFVVHPFVNAKGARSFTYLEAGLPAFIAERLAQHPPLRFVGGPSLLPRTPAPAAKWIVEGNFERLPDWQLEIHVKVRAATGPDAVWGEATRVGAKDEAPRLALEAALDAFGKVPGVKLGARPEGLLAPFGRDPYAFVLFGRGMAAYARLDLPKGAKPLKPTLAGERALELFKKCLVIDPKVPETRRLAGQIHQDAGRPGHARAMWTYALDVRPNYVAALTALAALDRTAGLPAARERYARIVELDPEDVEARRALGELLSDEGHLEQAQAELEKVVAALPADMRARRALVLVLAAKQAGSELVTELEQVVKLDPDDMDARMDMAAAYASVGRLAEAEATYDEVLRRKPRHAAALKLTGDLARARGDVKKAAACYGKLRWVAPLDPRPVFLLGTAQYEAGNLDAAERWFAEGSRFPGMMGDAYSNLGAIALKRGNMKQAISLLSRATKRRPGKANVRFNYAMALYANSRHADSLNELRTAATLDPGDAGIRFFAGVVSLRLGLLKEAEKSFRDALRLDPRHDDAKHNLALLEQLHPRGEHELSFIDGAPTTLEMPVEVTPAKAPAPKN